MKGEAMATSSMQDREFIASVISSALLEDAIDWIRENLEPEDVFGDKTLEDWARTWAEENYVEGE